MKPRSRTTQFVATLIAIIMNLMMTASSAAANEPVIGKTETCEASWYGPGLQGNHMANGDIFDMNDPTVVAHKEVPFGTILIITNHRNQKSMAVEVQDRGPFVKDRCVDLSRAGAQALDYYTGPRSGTTIVTVAVCEENCPTAGTIVSAPEYKNDDIEDDDTPIS